MIAAVSEYLPRFRRRAPPCGKSNNKILKGRLDHCDMGATAGDAQKLDTRESTGLQTVKPLTTGGSA